MSELCGSDSPHATIYPLKCTRPLLHEGAHIATIGPYRPDIEVLDSWPLSPGEKTARALYVYNPRAWSGDNATAIYLSGPMTGIPEFNFPAFNAACHALRATGLEVISPHELIDCIDQPWTYYIRQDLIAMLMHCNSIALLPGWECSKGANLEYHVALSLKFKVYHVVDNQLVLELP